MEKEKERSDLLEGLLPSKILRRKSSGARVQRPKSHEIVHLPEPVGEPSVNTNSTFAKAYNQSRDPYYELNDWDELIGHPVCIGGIKEGILRYYGHTKFADGLWCGVELREPVGKNDGTVNGVRYFYCKPNHGIFAPVAKVSLLPHDKLNDLNGDQNFYRKQDSPRHTLCSDVSFLKQSSSDPTFQKLSQGTFISYINEGANFLGDKRSLTEQRELNAIMDSRNDLPCPKFMLPAEKCTLPFMLNNCPPSPNVYSFVEHKKLALESKSFEMFGYKEAQEDYMSFPRKVMSEYSLTSHARKTALRESHSCPHSKLGLRSMDTEKLSPVATPTNPQKAVEDREARYSNDCCQHAYRSFMPSSEFLDFQDDNDDDQMSLDYDESLGILTPSEMKDFTLCADLPTSRSDTRALDFPSSESFDEVNDLPEDEQVHDVSVQYISSGSPSFVQSVAVSQPSVQSSVYSKNKEPHQAINMKHVLRSTDQFLSNISSKNGADIRFDGSYPTSLKEHFSALEEKKLSFAKDNGLYLNSNKGINLLEGPTRKDKVQSKLLGQQDLSNDPDESLKYFMPLSSSEDNEKLLPKQHFETEVKTRKNYDTDSSRDSLLQNDQEQMLCKEKLTVSWEDCVTNNTDEAFSKVERPESVYTVGSNDTGYQEDGEFEPDIGMTTSVESSEGKRFSMVSRDSCVVEEDIDGDKVAESTSTSGYSTGLSDSCCNEKHEEGVCRPMEDSFQDVGDSCNSDDAFNPERAQQEGQRSMEKSEGFFDMDSYKDTESASEFHITESSTVLGLDSTCETLSETIVEDVTLVEKEKTTTVNSVCKNSKALEKAQGDKGVSTSVQSNTNSAKTARTTDVIMNSTTSSSNKTTPEKKSQESKRSSMYNGPKFKLSEACRDSSKANLKKPDLKSPRRNVMSKIKAVIGGSRAKSADSDEVNKKPATPKKSRWEAVTSKIAASLAEEKTKPRFKKEVRSRVDTNLTAARQTCRSPRLDLSSASEGKADQSVGSSTSSKSRKNTDKQRTLTKSRECRHAAVPVSSGVDNCAKVPRPSKTCCSSRSISPVAASESSTSVSLTSHQSRSKIAVWKGSNSTVASSAAPMQVKKPPSTAVLRSSNPVNRLTNKDTPKPTPAAKIRVNACPVSPRTSSKLEASTKSPCPRLKSSKEQSGGSRALVAPRPVRPPMWLSKAELSQEIQHLSTLCEARTKELNRLKLETRHVTTGFDALAVVIRYMSAELNAFQNPGLATDLKEAQEKLNKGKKDLEYYEREIEKLNFLHVNEVNSISEKLTKEHESKFQELIEKHNAQLSALKEEHAKEIESLKSALQASCDEEKQQHKKMIDDLQEELRKQREEMEIFHQHELDDLEERHLEKQKSLLAEVEKLQKQCEEAKQLSLTMEDALQKDTDSKLQWLSAKRLDLQNEVDSLKAVLEIKNNELHSLRKENLEMQKELEELPLAKEKIKMLQARAEDLQALMAEKVRLERQLSTEHQSMKETYEREAKVNKRLSMENEELLWRLKQVNEASLLSTSVPDECETELPECPDLSSSCPPTVFEEAPSPVKSPHPSSASRPVFFTYMNQEELKALSPQSPRTHYKRIQPHKSPAKPVNKSPSVRSPRRSTDSSPHCTEGTPRKMARHVSKNLRDVSNRRRREDSTDDKTQNVCPDSLGAESNMLVMPDSMVSSASSENSVFEPCALEEHGEQICASLEILQEQRSSDASSLCYSSESKWPILQDAADNALQIHSGAGQDICGELIDPKTYYHMTFPVKDTAQDIDLDDVGKERLLGGDTFINLEQIDFPSEKNSAVSSDD